VPKSLAEIVIDEELASPEDVDSAAEVSDRKGSPLVTVLIRDFSVDEVNVVAAMKRHLRVPLLDPDSVTVEPEALRVLPHEVCKRLRVVPLSVADYNSGPRLLRVAMADPTDRVSVAEVEHHSGCRVEAALMTLSAVEEMVEKVYKRFVTQVIQRGKAGTSLSAAGKTEASAERTEPENKPSTVPFHRITDDAELSVRHRALIELLLEKHIISEDEYEEQVRLLMKGHEEDA